MLKAHPWTFEACFSTAPLPTIKLGTANLNTCQKGKFQGIIPRIIPSGCIVTNPF